MPLLRALYHSFFFPLSPSLSPVSAPTQPPSSPPFPKYPSTTTTTTATLPFFPTYPSPPPPPPPAPPSVPTFPANISSLTLPASSHSAPRQPSPSKLLLSIFIPILTLLLLLSLLLLLQYLRRRRRQTRTFNDAEDSRSDSHRLFPPNSAPSDIPKLDTSSRPTSSEFLYLGTLVSSRPQPQVPPAAPPPVRSPELRPLPPLSRPTADAAESSSDEFYSPKAAPLEKNFGSNSSSSSSSPTVSSLPVSSSPSVSTIESLTTKKTFDGDSEKNVNQKPKLLHLASGGVPPERLPPPPPPPPLVPPRYDRCENGRRVKLKALHWDKLPPSSGRAMVWDQLKKSGSFQLNEEMIESLFVCNAAKIGSKGRREEFSSPGDGKMVLLDPKKSQNIAILLKAWNVSKEDVCDALLEGNADSLGCELLETLQKMAPNKEEEHKLKEHKNDSNHKLGLAETFLKAILGIPFAFKRVDAMLYIANFNSEVNHLKQSFQTLEEACDDLRNSRLFLKLLEAVLKTGNRMNIGTNRGDARAFKLDTLVKLVDVKGTDGKTTLLHFVVQEIVKAEGYRRLASGTNQANVSRDDQECKRLGLQVLSRLGDELINVKKAAAMDFDMLCSSSSKLAAGIDKIRDVVRLKNISERFHESMTGFLRMAEGEIVTMQMQEGVAMSMVRELTEYFHGDSAKEEAHPFRIFMVVRDFLSILDRVCKEVNTKDDRAAFISTVPCHSPVCRDVSSGSSDDSEAFSSSP